MSLLTITDKIRNQISPGLNSVTKSRLGQFLTPSSIAGFMALLFSQPGFENIRLLDAGAGLVPYLMLFSTDFETRISI